MPDFMIGKMLVPACMVLVGAAGVAGAQSADDDSTDEQLLQCARIAESAQRIACYDELAKQVEPRPAPSPAPAAAATPADTHSAPVAEPEATVRPAGSSSPAPAASAAPARTGEPHAVAESKADGATASKVDTAGPPERPAEIRATIVESARSGIDHFVVQLDNGQIWEETDGSRRLGLPKKGSSVVIYEGRFGGHRMKIGNDNRIAWVRRLE